MSKFDYVLRLADSPLILGQRLCEWCGHGPILEQDIALSNIALDLLGLSRNFFQYAAELKGEGITEDDLAFTRQEREYHNFLICEQENGHWGKTILRQFFFDVYQFYYLHALKSSSDEKLAAIAVKSIKEVTYHMRYSSEWVIRLGDGTEESHAKMLDALEDLWPFTGELIQFDALDLEMEKNRVVNDLAQIPEQWNNKVRDILSLATLPIPEKTWMQKGGKSGVHTEAMGFILAEMQYMQRTYPGQQW